MDSLPETFRKIISFLEEEKFDYLVIGELASATLGEPRMTQDVDICLFIKKLEVKEFLLKLKQEGFSFDEKGMIKRAKERGTFQVFYGNFHIDFIILSTDFEKSALKRKQKIKLYGIEASFPTPEDLILFKIVPARLMDMMDIENIVIRHSGKLDEKYLLSWAQKLSDEAEDIRIYNEIKRLLNL
ncbi:MAG: nucleotidyltransferase [bacterium]